MKLFLYWVIYMSAMDNATYNTNGVITFDAEKEQATTWIHDVGTVTWTMEECKIHYFKESKIVYGGYARLKWGNHTSVIVIRGDTIEQNINGKETIKMLINKNYEHQ